MKRAALAAGATLALAGAASADVFTNVPSSELASYQLVYQLSIPVSSPGWNTAGVLTGPNGYSVNNSGSIAQGSFSRVAYYMELTGATNANYPNGWIYVSFDAAGFTNRADRIGIPGTPTSEVYQQNLSNMTIMSNVPGVVTGSGISTGNIEFWPSNYSQGNGRTAANGGAVPNASGSTYDFGDTNSGGSGHGSMQIHNYDIDGAGPGTAGQTLFAYNAWGSVRVSEMGIGNNPVTTQAPDWTVTGNADDAGAWTSRSMQILVMVPEPSSMGAVGLGALGLLARRRRGSAN
jgi:hypothetical protein